MTTDAEHFRQIDALFLEAVELPAGERGAFLEARCGTNVGLRRDVEALLAADEKAAEGIDRLRPFDGDGWPAPGSDGLVGRRVGPWLVDERVAEGGMGVVYRARRADGLYEQEVALKVLRPIAASDASVRRFELERQLLARLEHPGIARLIDGGHSEDGLPYLAMEFVDGKPIDGWCAENKVDLRGRIEIFIQICRAVHYAHTNLVLHRDLKPENLLVDGVGRARVVDFGIGRALENGEAVATLTGARAMTPAYASPEQCAGRPLGTSTDTYSLGVVLFELLTGERPWRREGRSPEQWERIHTAEAPRLPSAVMTVRAASTATFAGTLGATPVELRRSLRGDLDRVVAMALHVDPGRRYASTEQVVDALIRADKDFDLLVMPGVGHGAAELPYGTRRRRSFFVRHLLGVP